MKLCEYRGFYAGSIGHLIFDIKWFAMRDNSLKDLVLRGVVGGQSMVFESK